MKTNKIKTPKKGAVQRLRELQKKNRGKVSSELLDILKVQKEPENKQSAKPQADKDLEL